MVTIPGTRRVARLDESVGLAEIVLSPAEVKELFAAIPPGAAMGTRYPAGGMAGVFV